MSKNLCTIISLLSILSCQFCNGIPYDSAVGRVIGGGDAPPGSAPHQAILRALNTFECAGSIISKKTILTVAHCLHGVRPEILMVTVGTNELNFGGVEYEVADIKIHPDYDVFSASNDVALVILSKEIMLTPLIAIIPLETDEVGTDVDVTFTGWGMTIYPGGSYSNSLQMIKLKTISNSDCTEKWQDFNKIFPSQICTFTIYGQGTCRGDSGGSLVADGKLVGFFSWGYSCAIGYPDVFSRVSSFGDWIQQNMEL